jgi:hypothetical protein
MAGGAAATALVDADADDEALLVMVTVGRGFGLLFPQADSAAAVATAHSSAAAGDLYVAAGIWISIRVKAAVQELERATPPLPNKNQVTIVTVPSRMRQ